MDKSELPSWAKQPAIEWLNYVEDIKILADFWSFSNKNF